MYVLFYVAKPVFKDLKFLIQHLQKLYYESDEEGPHVVCAVAMLELAKIAQEPLKHYYKEIVPLVFIARYDPKEEVKNFFKECWDEIAVGGISLYVDDVYKAIVTSFQSSSWNLKKQAAEALSGLADTAAKYMNENLLRDVVYLLIQNLQG